MNIFKRMKETIIAMPKWFKICSFLIFWPIPFWPLAIFTLIMAGDSGQYPPWLTNTVGYSIMYYPLGLIALFLLSYIIYFIQKVVSKVLVITIMAIYILGIIRIVIFFVRGH